MNNLIIGFCHQSCAFWKIGLNGYQLLLLGTSKSGFAKREGKDGLLMHALIPAVFSLFFLPLSFFLSVLFLLLISNYYLAVGCFPFGLFFSWVPLSRCLLLSYHGFSPLKCFPPLSLPLSVFFSLPLFYPPLFAFGPPFLSTMVTFLLQQTDSM